MIEANNLPIQSLLDGWPDPVAADLKQTLRQRFSGGQFKFVKAEFQGAFVSETSALTLSSLVLKASLPVFGQILPAVNINVLSQRLAAHWA